jgi:hypothetical protein
MLRAAAATFLLVRPATPSPKWPARTIVDAEIGAGTHKVGSRACMFIPCVLGLAPERMGQYAYLKVGGMGLLEVTPRYPPKHLDSNHEPPASTANAAAGRRTLDRVRRLWVSRCGAVAHGAVYVPRHQPRPRRGVSVVCIPTEEAPPPADATAAFFYFSFLSRRYPCLFG